MGRQCQEHRQYGHVVHQLAGKPEAQPVERGAQRQDGIDDGADHAGGEGGGQGVSQQEHEGGGAPEELVGRREPMHQQIPDADAGQVAAGQQDGFEQGLAGEEGGEKKAQYAAGPARRCGQAWIAHHAAEHDRIGRPEGRQQVGGAGEDADQREQQYQGGDTQQSGQGRQCA